MSHRALMAAPFAPIFGFIWGLCIVVGSWVGKILPWGAMTSNEFQTWLLVVSSGISILCTAGIAAWQRIAAAKRETDKLDETIHRDSLAGKLEAATAEREAINQKFTQSEADRANLRKKLNETQDRLDRLYTGLPAWLLNRLEPADSTTDATPCPIPNNDPTPPMPYRPEKPSAPPPPAPPQK